MTRDETTTGESTSSDTLVGVSPFSFYILDTYASRRAASLYPPSSSFGFFQRTTSVTSPPGLGAGSGKRASHAEELGNGKSKGEAERSGETRVRENERGSWRGLGGRIQLDAEGGSSV